MKGRDCPQAMWMSYSNSMFSDNHLYMLKGRLYKDPLKEKLSQIPQIEWKCPPEFVLSHHWHVAAGEESEEVKTQKQREMRMLEAVYHRTSDIPLSPSLPLDMQGDHLDDSQTPVIPITPIEEGAANMSSASLNASFDPQPLAMPSQGFTSRNPKAPLCDTPASLRPTAKEKPALEVVPGCQADVMCGNSKAPSCDSPVSPKPAANEKPVHEVVPGCQADVVAAAATAMTAILKSKEEGSLIDTNLLIKFLNDPKMLEKLISEQVASSSTKTEPISGSKPLTAVVPLPSKKLGLIQEDGSLEKAGSTSISRSNLVTPSIVVPGPKPNPMSQRLTLDPVAAANTGAASISVSKLVTPAVAPLPSSSKPYPFEEILIHTNRAPTSSGAAPYSGLKPLTSQVAFPCPRPDPVLEKLVNKQGLLTDAGSAPFSVGKLVPPTHSFRSSKPDVEKYKRMIDCYGKEYEHISRSLPSNLPVSMANPKLDVVSPARLNSHRLPNEWDTSLQLKALSPDAVRPNLNKLPNAMRLGLRPKAPSPDDKVWLNSHPLPNNSIIQQPSSRLKAHSPDSGVTVSSFSANSAPPAKDINYFKSLIKQHGEMHETKVYNHSQSGKFHFHLNDMKLVPNLKPNEPMPKVQKPCIFFNGPKGCRSGSYCPYLHENPTMLQPGSGAEAPSATKRMKLDREITALGGYK